MRIINDLMKEAVLNEVFPGGVLLASQGGAIHFFEAYGYANIFTKEKISKETVFDLASLTKPLATTLAIIKLFQQEKLNLDQSLGEILTDFKDTDKSSITVKHLLSHSSGLPAYRSYFDELNMFPLRIRKKKKQELLVSEPLVNPIGKNELYSDIGFMILEWVVETVSGIRLDRFIEKEVYIPLELKKLFYIDLNSKDSERQSKNYQFAATEFCSWRNALLTGVVHDDNAYSVGGIAGHAGLFGTATNVHALLTEIFLALSGLSNTGVFQQRALQIFLGQHERHQRALGFDTPSEKNSSSGNYFSVNSVGHLGYTGVSFWMDLDRFAIIILLTNRVHPSRSNEKIKKFRPKIHNQVMKYILSLS